jgi:hypothetical protein
MVLRQIAIFGGSLFLAIAVHANWANALSMQECSAKYKAAKEAGSLGGMKWNDFRKAQCGADATAAPTPSIPPSAAPPAPTAAPTPPKSTVAKPSPTPVPAATSNAVFPSAVSPKRLRDGGGGWLVNSSSPLQGAADGNGPFEIAASAFSNSCGAPCRPRSFPSRNVRSQTASLLQSGLRQTPLYQR